MRHSLSAILLPLSESGERIDGISAAIAYREVTVVEDLPVLDAISDHEAAAARLRMARQNGAGGWHRAGWPDAVKRPRNLIIAKFKLL